jgi:hypothetical protein
MSKPAAVAVMLFAALVVFLIGTQKEAPGGGSYEASPNVARHGPESRLIDGPLERASVKMPREMHGLADRISLAFNGLQG